MKKKHSKLREKLSFKLFFGEAHINITDKEVKYFKKHPEEIEEFSAPINVHKIFLLAGSVLGVGLVGLSKLLKSSFFEKIFSAGLSEFFVDIVFEIGVALIGAVITAYLLGILLNQQQKNARKWRTELRKRIDALEQENKNLNL